jgi:hypothetical protein
MLRGGTRDQASLLSFSLNEEFNKHNCFFLKGLSHEIDFKKFEFFRGSKDFKMQNVYLFWLMPVCVGLTMVSCLFLSVPPITSGV